MQLPTRYRRGQTKPWPSIPRIDWSHPLAQGLFFYAYDAGGVLIDLVSGAIGQNSAAGSRPGFGTSKVGGGVKWPGLVSTTGQICFPNNANIQAFGQSTSVGCTAALGFYKVADPASTGTCQVFTIGEVGNVDNEFLVFALDDGAIGGITYFGGNTNPTNNTGLVTAQAYHTAAMTFNANLNPYFDGAALATAGNTPVALSTARVIFNGFLDDDPTAAADFNGFIYYAALWSNRALTTSEHQTLHQDPYCFLIYPEDDLFALMVGAAANAVAMLGRAATMAMGRSAPLTGKAGLSGIAKAQAKAAAAGVYKMPFVGKATASAYARATQTSGMAFLAKASAQAKLKASGAYSAALSGIATSQAKAQASGVYKMAFSGLGKATSALKGVASNSAQLAAAGTIAAKAYARGSLAGIAALSGKATTQAKAQASGVYKMPFVAVAKATSTAKALATVAAGLAASGSAVAQAKLKAGMSLSASLSGRAAAQAQATASGVYTMAFSGKAQTQTKLKAAPSFTAFFQGAVAAQAKLKSTSAAAASLAGRAAAQAKAQASGIYTMAFTAKSATQAKASTVVRNTIFLIGTIASQAKAKTGNTLRVIMSGSITAASRVSGVYTRFGVVPASRFFAYFIS
jgi:hypothetical protein